MRARRKKRQIATVCLVVLVTGCFIFFRSGLWSGARWMTRSAPAKKQAQSVPDTKRASKPQPALPVVVPILYYHAIDDHIQGISELFVSPADFDRQLAYLKNNGYTVIGLDQLDRAGDYKKPVLITFDDGYQDNYLYAYPILKKYHYQAAIFMITGFVGKPGYLTSAEIREMGDLVSFQSHTVTHAYLAHVSPQIADYEIPESQRMLEEITGKPVFALAYPNGETTPHALQVAKKYYRYGFLKTRGFYHTATDDPYLIQRLYIPRGMDIQSFAKKITIVPGS
jgi:peptidoglycan/xylan/chitin deacetylase (PgdA/CDA1 family)